MATCPLCSDILLRHIRPGQPYWLCRRCRLEILDTKNPVNDCSSVPLPLITIERSLTTQTSASIDRLAELQPAATTEV